MVVINFFDRVFLILHTAWQWISGNNRVGYFLQAIPSQTERRSIFDHYVRTRAEEERKEKRAAQKAAIEGFKQLLDEASKVSDCFNASMLYHHCLG